MISTTPPYDDFFNLAFEHPPFAYQRRIATDAEMPALINIPTGAGKTAAILGAWLWRRLRNRHSVGRRLIYCLPMRTLVEQTANEACKAIRRLVGADIITGDDFKKGKFAVHVLMGGAVAIDWDVTPERECIIIGTQDMLLSRALNRGYAMNPFRWPVQFGLLNNDCLWVFDEVQLMGNALATSTQLTAFRERFKTFGRCDSLWMSATLDEEWLKTVDFKARLEELPPERRVGLEVADRNAPALKDRLQAHKVLNPAPQNGDESCRTPEGLARFAKNRHNGILEKNRTSEQQQSTQTLIIVNRVARAREVYEWLEKGYKAESPKPQLKLIHSRFRPAERQEWLALLKEKPLPESAGKIIVATQVAEAGLDISSRLLITDIAPVASLVQRFGRCNREGEHSEAEIYWIDRPLLNANKKLADVTELNEMQQKEVAAPYEWTQLETSDKWLRTLPSASIEDMEGTTKTDNLEPQTVLRERELLNLFDTMPDLSGGHIDVSPYVRGGDEKDVMVAWREVNKALVKGKLPKKTERLRRDELCPVPIGELKKFLEEKDKNGNPLRIARTWNIVESEWQRVAADELRPGMMILLDVSDGGYDKEQGWNPALKKALVEPVPPREKDESLLGDAEQAEAGVSDDPHSHTKYIQTLRAHSREVKGHAGQIVERLADLGLEKWRDDLLTAAQHHDWGKAHKIFQNTLHKKIDSRFESLQLAKSNNNARHERTGFRHELASALALLSTGEARDLAVYLTACHHGIVRLSIRANPKEHLPYVLGIADGEELPAADLGDGLEKERITLDLEPMLLGTNDAGVLSWFDRMSRLAYGAMQADEKDDEALGIFRLAFLESLIVAADVRASKYPEGENWL